MKNKHEKQQKNLIFYRSKGGQLSPDYPIDGYLPKNQYGQITIEWGDKKFNLPRESYDDLFEPNFKQGYAFVRYDKENKRLYIYGANSDGAGGYEVLWVIENKKYKSRHLSNAYA